MVPAASTDTDVLRENIGYSAFTRWRADQWRQRGALRDLYLECACLQEFAQAAALNLGRSKPRVRRILEVQIRRNVDPHADRGVVDRRCRSNGQWCHHGRDENR